MRERGVTDEAFFALAGALAEGARAQTTALPAPSGLHLALLRQAGVAPPAALAVWAPATNLLSQASGDSVIRLAASERAAVADHLGRLAGAIIDGGYQLIDLDVLLVCEILSGAYFRQLDRPANDG